jgi:hypothetical protein
MNVIDLGEPGVYEPGEPPIFGGYRRLSRAQRRRALLVAAFVVLAGSLGGVVPRGEPDPQLHLVGNIRGPLTQVLGDTVISYSDESGEIVAYPLDGEGPRWSLPADQPPSDIATAGDLFVVAFIGLSYLESTTNTQRVMPSRILAVEAASGRPRWQVTGSPVSQLSGPIVAVATGDAGAQKVVGIDVYEGRQLWEVPLAGVPVTRLQPDGIQQRHDEIVIVGPDGAVFTMALADGRTRSAGRIALGAKGLFEWRGLLAARLPAKPPAVGAEDDFLVYRLGEDRPLWQVRLPEGLYLVPCGDQLCAYDSSGYRRYDPLTGSLLATVASDSTDPYAVDDDPWRDWYAGLRAANWEPISMYKGHALVRLDPSFSNDRQSWLGDATLRGKAVSVRPLMPIGPRSNSCVVTSNWLFCDGSAVEDAVAVRLTELDRLLGV